MRVTRPQGTNRRRGVILLVVLAMLTLLTVIGVTFVLYSDNAESTARISMEGEKTVALTQPANWDTDELLAYGFGQLIYDAAGDVNSPDDDPSQRSGLRGHSLARDMYGFYYPRTGVPTDPAMDNDRPFRGTGRFEAEKDIVNFTTFKANGSGTIRDPERPGTRTVPTMPNSYSGGFNPPYTSPDFNHVFLAKTDVDPATGNLVVVEPSFVRLASIPNSNPMNSPLDSGNSYWNDAAGDPSRSIRPRPANHNRQFPPPASPSGDVRNLPWGRQNDSVWIDLGVPPKTAPNGKRYKPLFAFLAIDLDGRVNVNAHGNVQGRDGNGAYAQRHASGQGWGPWEVSLERLMGGPQGKAFVLNRQPGLATATTIFDIPTGGNLPHTFSPVNYNGSVEQALGGGVLDQPILMPGVASAYSPFRTGDSKAYGQGLNYERSQNGTNSAYMGTDRVHGATWHSTWSVTGNSHMKADSLGWTMGRYLRSPTKFTDSLVYQWGGFASSPFVSTGRDTRLDKLTTMSWDLDRPGIVPYFTDAASQGVLLAPLNTMIPINTSYPRSAADPAFPNTPPVAPAVSDFDSVGRSRTEVALAKRLNLNRGLSNYPAIQNNGTYLPADIPLVVKAITDRQLFAKDILSHLVKATGAADPSDSTLAATVFVPGGGGGGTDQRYLATRWLAQLAVNMVDNLDADDVMTPFIWNPNDPSNVLFGHEMSRVAINEVYAQVENEPSEIATGVMTSPTKFHVKVYAELMNPLPSDPNYDHSAVLQKGAQVVHKLELLRSSVFDRSNAGSTDLANFMKTNGIIGNLASPADSLADPFASTNWGGDLALNPRGAFAAPNGQGINNGILMVGAQPDNMNNASGITNARWTTSNRTDTFHADLKYVLPKAVGMGDESAIDSLMGLQRQQVPVLVLRRLANPGLPADNNPLVGMTTNPNPLYNPYITIDLMDVTKEMLVATDARKKVQDPADATKNKDNGNLKSIDQRASFGRQQPFRYVPKDFNGQPYGSLAPQNPSENAMPSDQPKTTFWRENLRSNIPPAPGFIAPGSDTLETPFPRIHLDRIVTSPTEIMTTPYCRPHEYLLLNDGQFSYCRPWFDSSTRLYRFLEFAQAGETRALAYGGGNRYPVGDPGGRIPGKINLNTVSREVFLALCDAQAGNRFIDSQVAKLNPLDPAEANKLYETIVSMRPFKGLAAGNSAGGDALSPNPRGRYQTIFANHPLGVGADAGDQLNLLMDPLHQAYNGGPLLSANGLPSPAPMATTRPQEFHPSVRLELLNKILSRSTSRSNCFAVWLTVGFFEVVTEQGGSGGALQPVHVLGKEMEPKIRRRFFCMVDRTNLEKWRTNVVQSTGAPITIPPDDATKYPYLATPVPIQLSALFVQATPTPTPLGSGVTNALNGKTLPVSLGSVLTLNPGDSQFEETVEVVDIGMGVPGIMCQKAHPNGLIVSSRGNPGPMPNLGLDYKIEKDALVVPFFAVLE
ncbi:MAG: hypothetical protein ACKO9Z_08435 [Planctomycetota bacterium]